MTLILPQANPKPQALVPDTGICGGFGTGEAHKLNPEMLVHRPGTAAFRGEPALDNRVGRPCRPQI